MFDLATKVKRVMVDGRRNTWGRRREKREVLIF